MTKSERILAAKDAYKNDPERSLRAIYEVSHKSIANHVNGKHRTATDYGVTRQRLTPAEEAVLVKYVQLAYKQAFPVTTVAIRDMANEILVEKGCEPSIGVHWHQSFLKRHPELRSALSRPIDKQRVMSEDPDSYIHYFHLFEDTRAKYGISDNDTYNMDESGCAIGVEHASKIIIPADEKETFAKQDGKREWATDIECVGANGDKAPLFIILAGKVHLVDNWNNVRDSRGCLALSDNGWTNDELGFQWLQHFDAWSSPRKTGAYRLLLLDGHRSHLTLKFLRYAVDHQIILLCLPPHSTHRLQPLDVGIFGPMGTAYDALVKRFNRYDGRGVTQREYIDWIQQARDKACSKKNIESAFAATGLIPFNPNRVLSKLKEKKEYDRPRTPPEAPSEAPSKAPPAPPQPTITPFCRIQQGTMALDVPVNSVSDAEALIDRIGTATPSRANHIAALKALIQWQRADNAILNQQVRSFEDTRANKKPRKKTRIKGSAKVYTKEEVDAMQAAAAEKERMKELRLAEKAAKKARAANNKAGKQSGRQQQQEIRQERQPQTPEASNATNRRAKRNTRGQESVAVAAAATTPAGNRQIRMTRAAANYQLMIREDVFE
jgi:hypothetical protein